MKLVLIQDMAIDGTHWGGAEKDDRAMLDYLIEKTGVDIEYRLAKDWHSLEDNEYYILSNFFTCKPILILDLCVRGGYSIYEHDHHYCMTRNPYSYGHGFIVPQRRISNRTLFRDADKVFCMSKKHKDVLDANITCNSVSITTSFWSPEDLQELENLLNTTTKIPKACVHNSDAPHKRTHDAIAYCEKNGLDYELIESTPDPHEFLRRMSQYEKFVFFAGSPETFNRSLVEAKMLGLSVVTNEMAIGAAGETLWQYKGQELIDYIRDVAIPESLDIIIEGIPCLK